MASTTTVEAPTEPPDGDRRQRGASIALVTLLVTVLVGVVTAYYARKGDERSEAVDARAQAPKLELTNERNVTISADGTFVLPVRNSGETEATRVEVTADERRCIGPDVLAAHGDGRYTCQLPADPSIPGKPVTLHVVGSNGGRQAFSAQVPAQWEIVACPNVEAVARANRPFGSAELTAARLTTQLAGATATLWGQPGCGNPLHATRSAPAPADCVDVSGLNVCYRTASGTVIRIFADVPDDAANAMRAVFAAALTNEPARARQLASAAGWSSAETACNDDSHPAAVFVDLPSAGRHTLTAMRCTQP